MRGRSRSKGPNPLTRSYESNGPDVKIRGTAQHIADKYAQLARDSQSSGDHVSAENYHQHAEHYYRLIAAAQEQFRQQYGTSQRPFDEDGDEGDDEGPSNGFGYGDRQAGGHDEMGDGAYPSQPYVNGDRNPQRYDRNERYDRGGQDRGGQDRGIQDRGGQDRGGQDRNQRFDRNAQDRNGGAPERGDRNGRAPDRNVQERNSQDRNPQERGGPERGSPERHAQDRNGQERNAQDRNAQDRNGQDRNAQDRNGQDRNGQDRGYDRANGMAAPERVVADTPERGDRPERQPGERRERYQRRDRAPRAEATLASDEAVTAELPAFLTNPVRPPIALVEPEPEPTIAVPSDTVPDAGEARPKRRPRVRRVVEAVTDVEKAAE